MAEVFFSTKPCKNGHFTARYVSSGICLECSHQIAIARDKERNRANAKRWVQENPDKAKDNVKRWRAANKDKAKAFRKKWEDTHKDKRKEYASKHVKRHRQLYAAYENKRRAMKLLALPPWVDHKALNEIYKNCPHGFHVDHIIPLNNPIVCGLHVPWNLQYLPAAENIRKRNSLGALA